MGRFLSNTYDPRLPDARKYHQQDYHDWQNGPEAIEQSWQRHLEWINQNVIGPPQASEKYTVAELEKMGLVGIYAPEPLLRILPLGILV